MACDLVLHCLPMSHKKDARLILVNKGTGPTARLCRQVCVSVVRMQQSQVFSHRCLNDAISGEGGELNYILREKSLAIIYTCNGVFEALALFIWQVRKHVSCLKMT